MKLFCADTSCWIAYLAGEAGSDTELLGEGLEQEAVVMAPVALAELFSAPELTREVAEALRSLPLLEVTPGFWARAGRLRASLRRHHCRPKLADTLIAQSCLDYAAPLLTRDRDFRPFARHAGLELVF